MKKFAKTLSDTGGNRDAERVISVRKYSKKEKQNDGGSSCCRPSQTGSRPRSLPRRNWISSLLFLLCLPPPGYPSTPHRHRDDKCIPPRASETSAVPQNTSTWQTHRRPSVRPRAGITLNEFNSIKKRTKEECKITEEPLSSWWWWWLLFFPESFVLFCVLFFVFFNYCFILFACKVTRVLFEWMRWRVCTWVCASLWVATSLKYYQ